ncbi:unnamed protein product [Protopolystoma xenopodis]|uniref:Uncharacterized protein n=1 Tax=Protopolystoma xenopodis TaxID=117903 RepID=A0A448WCI0_9PLAT|nr:unnamed protein product [Protopolystoma xenopodis]
MMDESSARSHQDRRTVSRGLLRTIHQPQIQGNPASPHHHGYVVWLRGLTTQVHLPQETRQDALLFLAPGIANRHQPSPAVVIRHLSLDQRHLLILFSAMVTDTNDSEARPTTIWSGHEQTLLAVAEMTTRRGNVQRG